MCGPQRGDGAFCRPGRHTRWLRPRNKTFWLVARCGRVRPDGGRDRDSFASLLLSGAVYPVLESELVFPGGGQRTAHDGERAGFRLAPASPRPACEVGASSHASTVSMVASRVFPLRPAPTPRSRGARCRPPERARACLVCSGPATSLCDLAAAAASLHTKLERGMRNNWPRTRLSWDLTRTYNPS